MTELQNIERVSDKITRSIKGLSSVNTNERKMSILGLGNLSDARPEIVRAVPHLINLLHDRDPSIRKYTAMALGNIGHPSATVDLIDLLGDYSEDVSKAAYDAFNKIEEKNRSPYSQYVETKKKHREMSEKLSDICTKYFEPVLQDYKKSCEDPKLWDPRFQIGKVLLERAQFERQARKIATLNEAGHFFEEALKIKPDHKYVPGYILRVSDLINVYLADSLIGLEMDIRNLAILTMEAKYTDGWWANNVFEEIRIECENAQKKGLGKLPPFNYLSFRRCIEIILNNWEIFEEHFKLCLNLDKNACKECLWKINDLRNIVAHRKRSLDKEEIEFILTTREGINRR